MVYKTKPRLDGDRKIHPGYTSKRLILAGLKLLHWNHSNGIFGFATKLSYLYLTSLFYQLCPVFCLIDNSVHTQSDNIKFCIGSPSNQSLHVGDSMCFASSRFFFSIHMQFYSQKTFHSFIFLPPSFLNFFFLIFFLLPPFPPPFFFFC